MHITNQKLSFDIYTVGHLLNIFMEHDLNILKIFGIKEKMHNFDPYNILLAIAILKRICEAQSGRSRPSPSWQLVTPG